MPSVWRANVHLVEQGCVGLEETTETNHPSVCRAQRADCCRHTTPWQRRGVEGWRRSSGTSAATTASHLGNVSQLGDESHPKRSPVHAAKPQLLLLGIPATAVQQASWRDGNNSASSQQQPKGHGRGQHDLVPFSNVGPAASRRRTAARVGVGCASGGGAAMRSNNK